MAYPHFNPNKYDLHVKISQVKTGSHSKHKGTVSNGDYIMACTGGRPGCFGDNEKRYKLKSPTLRDVQEAMGVQHIHNFKQACEAIPPAYSRYIFSEFLKNRRARAGRKEG